MSVDNRLYCCQSKNKMYVLARKGGNMVPRKVGRPFSENPKEYRLDIRVTKEELEILDAYCKRAGVKRPQGIRDGIRELEKK